ncbi:hypothetical protein FSP39_012961 [Pinctada imbricata]|uniref:Reverse transcriptase domain-containing protein n=1 Tax=Pinctada imbricata TaxID=66713 RepID=A0AA88YEA1_PINIB|nr:hypothetical protein FSP39_012961 [Pinctada imbricata]
MLENDIIEPSNSDWSSPCILVPKPDETYRLCTDFRKVNSVTKTDSYPIPRIDDCIDKIGSAKLVSKFDLLKGYWQVPLTERAREISAFATPDGLYQYKVMPFGMKNAPATFQRMIHSLLNHLEGCEAYIDDVIIYSDTWDDHLRIMRTFFDILAKANLTVNLAKSEFCHATVEYLGHKVGQGFVTPIMAKVEAISKFPIPTNKKEIMRFLGMAGFYRKFCPNFSSVVGPLTNLLQKKVNFAWTNDCDESFKKIKCVLMNSPVLSAPNFDKQFKLTVDASDVGIGAALFQENDDGVDRVRKPYFLDNHGDILTIPRSKVIIVYVEKNQRNIILEDPDQELGDLRRTTVEAALKMGATVVVVYMHHEESRNLGNNELYCPKLQSVTRHHVLSKLEKQDGVFSVFDSYSDFQRQHLKKLISDSFIKK